MASEPRLSLHHASRLAPLRARSLEAVLAGRHLQENLPADRVAFDAIWKGFRARYEASRDVAIPDDQRFERLAESDYGMKPPEDARTLGFQTPCTHVRVRYGMQWDPHSQQVFERLGYIILYTVH